MIGTWLLGWLGNAVDRVLSTYWPADDAVADAADELNDFEAEHEVLGPRISGGPNGIQDASACARAGAAAAEAVVAGLTPPGASHHPGLGIEAQCEVIEHHQLLFDGPGFVCDCGLAVMHSRGHALHVLALLEQVAAPENSSNLLGCGDGDRSDSELLLEAAGFIRCAPPLAGWENYRTRLIAELRDRGHQFAAIETDT